jgi:hypothetical protein
MSSSYATAAHKYTTRPSTHTSTRINPKTETPAKAILHVHYLKCCFVAVPAHPVLQLTPLAMVLTRVQVMALVQAMALTAS